MSILRGGSQKTISMKPDLTLQEKERIWQLMCEKMAGIISPKDLRYLEAQLPKDEYMQEAFQTLAFALGQEENLDLERLQHDDEWKDIFQEIKPHSQRHTPLLKRIGVERVTAAAVLAGLLLSAAGYYYFSEPDIPAKVTATDIPTERTVKKDVMLLLADNRNIALPVRQTLVSLGDVQLHNTQQALSFDAKDAFTVHGQHTLIVPPARDYKVTLADGSEIWLNAASRLQFPFSFNGKSREITLLSGEAFVKAAPDPSKPFIIHTAHSTIQVLGTEFNINAYDRNMVRVSLVSGAVRMQAGTETAVIKPGTEAVYTNTNGLTTQPFDPREVLSWREGKHFFANAPMSEISAILARNMGITAVVDSGSAATTKHFSGVVNKHRPIEEFMQDMKNAVNVDYYFDKDGVLHFK